MEEVKKEDTIIEERVLEAKVYEARYRKIEGNPKPPSSYDAAKSMSIFEIRRGLRGTWPKVPLILAGFIVFGFIVQMNTILNFDAETFWIGKEGVPTEDGTDETGAIAGIKGSVSSLMTPMDGAGALMIIHIAVISAGLISGDIRDRAIDLYFSKIRLRTYFTSKFMASLALTFVGLPLFTVIYFIIAIYKRLPKIEDWGKELGYMAEVFLEMTVVIILVTVFLSSLVLIFSAYTSNPVNAGVMFLVFTLVSRVFFEAILYEATNIDLFYALSPISALDTLRRAVIAPDEISEQFLELSIFTYLLYIALSLAATWFKLKKEVTQ